jgi:hypothetical protein
LPSKLEDLTAVAAKAQSVTIVLGKTAAAAESASYNQ